MTTEYMFRVRCTRQTTHISTWHDGHYSPLVDDPDSAAMILSTLRLLGGDGVIERHALDPDGWETIE